MKEKQEFHKSKIFMKRILNIISISIFTLFILFFMKSFNKRLHHIEQVKEFDQISAILLHNEK